jgi:DNA-binding Xre family transcriptional regulator
MAIVIDLDVQLAKKKMSVSELAAAIDITPVNVSVLKNGQAKAVRSKRSRSLLSSSAQLCCAEPPFCS